MWIGITIFNRAQLQSASLLLKTIASVSLLATSQLSIAGKYKRFTPDLVCVANEQWGTHSHLIKIEFDFDHGVMRETDKLVCHFQLFRTEKPEGYNVLSEGRMHDEYDQCVLKEIENFYHDNSLLVSKFPEPRYKPFSVEQNHEMFVRFVPMTENGTALEPQIINKNYASDLSYWSWESPDMKGIYYTDLDYDVPCIKPE